MTLAGESVGDVGRFWMLKVGDGYNSWPQSPLIISPSSLIPQNSKLKTLQYDTILIKRPPSTSQLHCGQHKWWLLQSCESYHRDDKLFPAVAVMPWFWHYFLLVILPAFGRAHRRKRTWHFAFAVNFFCADLRGLTSTLLKFASFKTEIEVVHWHIWLLLPLYASSHISFQQNHAFPPPQAPLLLIME